MNWLDTQTQALLQAEPPTRLAPTKTAEYALVLLRKGCDDQRLARAIARINDAGPASAASLAAQPPPAIIHRDLRYEDAVLGQFELICCDTPAAVLSTEVLEQGDKSYLHSLFVQISQSPEFQPCQIIILQIPRTQGGEKFVEQFLGCSAAEWRELILPLHLQIPYKKARIMKHWAQRIGVVMGWARHDDRGDNESQDDNHPICRLQ